MAVLLGLSSMSPERALSWRLCLTSMAASVRTAPIASSVMTPSAASPAGWGHAAWCRIRRRIACLHADTGEGHCSPGSVTDVKAQCSACACSAALESPRAGKVLGLHGGIAACMCPTGALTAEQSWAGGDVGGASLCARPCRVPITACSVSAGRTLHKQAWQCWLDHVGGCDTCQQPTVYGWAAKQRH